MAEVQIIRTSCTSKEVMKGIEEKLKEDKDSVLDYLQLCLLSLDNKNIEGEHELGDILVNDHANRFAIIAKEDHDEKISIPWMRVCVLNFIKYLVENKLADREIIISRHEFAGHKEEIAFIATVKEFAMTFFSEALTNDIIIAITESKVDD